MNNSQLYFAYGMNTNQDEMAYRCPGAHSLGHARLIDHAFRFAVHADVVPCSGSYVDGVLWSITDQDLDHLDQLEGYPTYYGRDSLRVSQGSRIVQAVCYSMQSGHADSPPSTGYMNMVLEGYAQHHVPTEQLWNSVELVDQ
ncbi:gamma-glutamylcyclotransferase family protein [Haliscomenobacter sp.]|uniref:gamma-glutamylcyclotransferase family protein n=1 Tax=Haliscomenobacter sp. TaxID=2717303 RepID=UPI00336513A8